MTNSEVWQHYKEYTKDITEFSRKLAFGAGALCWFFKTSENIFPRAILWALIFLVGFFVMDILQSLLGALLLRYWIRKEEIKIWNKTGKIEGEYSKPVWLDRPSFICFIIKIMALITAFIFIAMNLFYIREQLGTFTYFFQAPL